MTEKSEDQVVWVCSGCNMSYRTNYCENFSFHNDEAKVVAHIPHSKYLALQEEHQKTMDWANSMSYDKIALKELLREAKDLIEGNANMGEDFNFKLYVEKANE